MPTLYPPGLRVPVTVPEGEEGRYLQQGWRRADDRQSRRVHATDPGIKGEITTTGEPVPPPKGGAGSGVAKWREYADATGVQVDDEASRDDVIAALDAAGVPTE